MSLRLRLIVVFFLLSVVPVGAVTYYTYSNNAQAIREAAGAEAEGLAGELSQRMNTVTTQLSQRVESLMGLEDIAAGTPSSSTTAAVPAPAASAAPVPDDQAVVRQVEDATEAARVLGAYADMLKNITIDYGRRGRRGGGPPPNGAFGGRGAFPGPPGEAPAPDGPPPVGATPADPQTPGGAPPSFGANGRGGAGRFGNGGPPQGREGGPGNGANGGRGAEPDDPGRIRIDLGQMRREMFESLLPDRETLDAMAPEERAQLLQRIGTQVDQRMQGVQQGIDVLRKELETRAVAVTEIRMQGDADAAAASATVVPAPTAAAAASSAAAPITRSTAASAPASAPAVRRCWSS